MSNVVRFPTPQSKQAELDDEKGRQDLRYSLAFVAGMLTRACSREEWDQVDSILSHVQLEVACRKMMEALK